MPARVQRTMGALAGISRAPFLLLPLTLVAVGSSVSVWEGSFFWHRSFLALVGLVALHAAVNAFNEVSDFRSGIDLATSRTPFSGGSGTLPTGAASASFGTGVAVAGAAVGLATGVWFLSLSGWRLLPVLVIGAVATLGYADFLARCYAGEVAAGLGLGAIPVLGIVIVMGAPVGPTAVAASIPAFLMTFNLLLLNEFPDEKADRAGGRRNLVLLLGRRRAAKLYVVAALAVPVSIVGSAVLAALPWLATGAILPSLLLFQPLRWAFRSPEQEVPVPALAANVAWNLATNSALAVCLVVATLTGVH